MSCESNVYAYRDGCNHHGRCAVYLIVQSGMGIGAPSDFVSNLNAGSTVNNIKKVGPIPIIRQNSELPRGCEVTSLAMLLNAAGVRVDKLELAAAIRKVPFEEDDSKGI